MLQFFRSASGTWLFKGLFVVLIASFAVWGIGDVSIGGAGNRVAKVGDEEIAIDDYARALQREMQSLSRRAGRNITMDEAQTLGIPQVLLARLTRDAALNGEAGKLGISADDAALRRAILQSPSFQGPDGVFDEQQYLFILNQLGFEVDRFETDMRRSLARDVISAGLTAGTRAAPGFAELALSRQLEKREMTLLILTADANADAPAPPDEATLIAWHRDNADDYVAPERRDAVWIAIDPQALIDDVDVLEDDLRAAYAAADERYNIPERRVVDRLSFPDTAAAMKAKAAIDAGEMDFAAAAAALDLKLDDVTLGEVTRDDLPADMAEAAFSGELGVAGPVKSGLGPALVNVRAILPGSSVSFEAARDELRAELAAADAIDLAAGKAEEVADLLAGGATLEEIAAETGLTLSSARGVAADGDGAPDGIARSADFLGELFAAEPGQDRDLIETPAGAWIALRVDAVAEAAPLDFEAARAKVLEDWTAAQRRDSLNALADRIIAELESGAPADAVAETHGLTPIRSGPITRSASLPGAPAALVETLFATPIGKPARVDEDASVAIGVVTAIAPPDLKDPTFAGILSQWQAAMDDSVGKDVYALYAMAIQNREGATVNPNAMEQVINQLR